jgi:hypothetical protein
MDAFYQQLGMLGAQLTGAEFGAEAVPPDQLETWLRTARALLEGAQRQLETETMRLANEPEPGSDDDEGESGTPTQPSETSTVKDTPCVGPCTFLWKGANRSERVKALMRKMQETESSSEVRTLYCEMMQLKPEGAQEAQTYQLCQLTGFPCATFTDKGTGLVPQSCATSTRITQLQERVRESRLMVDYAEHVVYSRLLREEAKALSESAPAASTAVMSGGGGSSLGAQHAQLVSACQALLSGGAVNHARLRLRGGGDHRSQSFDAARASIASFYKYVPDFRGSAMRDAMAAFSAATKTSDPGDALDFLVTGSVVEPLVRRISPLQHHDVRAALVTHWNRHVMSAGANLRSQH